MRDLLDELIDTVLQMWERSKDEEYNLEDLGLPIKVAMIAAEAEGYLLEEFDEDEIYSKKNKKFKAIVENSNGLKNNKSKNVGTFSDKSKNKKFKFFGKG